MELKLVATEYDKSRPSYVDGMDMYKSLSRDLGDDKDVIIKRLIEEICMLSHFIAVKMPDYVEFIGKVRNAPNKTGELLSLDLADPDMSKAEHFQVTHVGKVLENWEED